MNKPCILLLVATVLATVRGEEGLHLGSAAARHHHEKFPPLLDMAIHLRGDIRNRSCAPCNLAHPLGPQCCGMCGFWENLRYKNVERQPWVAPCKVREVANLMSDLKSRGMDLAAFEAKELFEIIKGRTLWLIGDSQTERWYDSIECFLSDFLTEEPRAAPLQDTSSNLWLMNLDERLPYQGSFWSPPKPAICAHYQDNTRVCNIRINKADELAYPALRVLHSKVQNLHRDIAVVNAGLHYGIGANQKYTEDLQFFLDFVAQHKDDLPLLIWKDTPPQHFTFEKGYFWWADGSMKGTTAGEKHERCRPLSEEELSSDEIKAGGWYNSVATPLISAAGIPIFDAYHETVPLWQFHMWDKDCTHFCHPGPYELWTFLLTDMLRNSAVRD
ncbi:hypothetical protein WJX75_005467 [Coccomyxa subellipsoidea]|uniref:Uncharacterized protein n=1 Tax=Coccomyxa subellipsoidea TaxID=248742 RepID=A0ABR2YQ05_9CHLO